MSGLVETAAIVAMPRSFSTSGAAFTVVGISS
jgi:hypothetical protein